jgi:hypothetical protein
LVRSASPPGWYDVVMVAWKKNGNHCQAKDNKAKLKEPILATEHTIVGVEVAVVVVVCSLCVDISGIITIIALLLLYSFCWFRFCGVVHIWFIFKIHLTQFENITFSTLFLQCTLVTTVAWSGERKIRERNS